MRVACVQTNPSYGAIEQNRASVLHKAAETDADLVVFPELAISGYQLLCRYEATKYSEPADGPTAAALQPICRAANKHVVVGISERAGADTFNSAILVGPNGLVGYYRKTHLFWDEPDWFEPGNTGFNVWDVNGVRIGIMICFDWAYPEAARSLAIAGADIIAHPSNIVLPYCQNAMPTRGLENRVFIATSNRCGEETRLEKTLVFNGRSIIVGPDAEVLAEAPRDAETTIYADITTARAREKNLTPRNHILQGRRPELYR